MTDEEILKRLAEIEGYKLSEYGFRYSTAFNAIIHYQDDDFSPWNPLHDDAQCLALVKKYRVAVAFYEGHGRLPAQWCAICRSEIQHTIEEIEATNASPSLNRAVCLAIIEAHK